MVIIENKSAAIPYLEYFDALGNAGDGKRTRDRISSNSTSWTFGTGRESVGKSSSAADRRSRED
jgi:hypothetical protein